MFSKMFSMQIERISYQLHKFTRFYREGGGIKKKTYVSLIVCFWLKCLNLLRNQVKKALKTKVKTFNPWKWKVECKSLFPNKMGLKGARARVCVHIGVCAGGIENKRL